MVIFRVSCSERTFCLYASDTNKFIARVLIFRVVTGLKFLRKTLRVRHATSTCKRLFPQFPGEDEKQGLHHGPGEGLTFGEMSVFNSHHLTSVSN